MSENESIVGAPRSIGRRTVIKGAAWTVPAIAAAVAMPLAAASHEGQPHCPGCLKPFIGAFTLSGVATDSRATLALANPLVLDATDCGSIIGGVFQLQPAFTYVVRSAVLKMSDNSTYSSAVGLAPGAGAMGAVGAMPAAFAFTNVLVDTDPNRGGAFGELLGLPPRIMPSSLTVQIDVTYQWGLGASLLCPVTLVYDLSSAVTLSLLGTDPVFGGGDGPVSYTGTVGIL